MNKQEQSDARAILVVDDEHNMREFISELLQAEGYTNVYQASDGIECLEILSRYGADIYLVLLDLMMPRMGGQSVIEHLVNAHPFVVGITIVSGYPNLLQESTFESLGSDLVFPIDYLEKPFQVDDLKDRIERALHFVSEKRAAQLPVHSRTLSSKIDMMQIGIERLREEIAVISARQRGFLSELGLDVLRVIIIAALVFALLYFGFDDILRSLLSFSP